MKAATMWSPSRSPLTLTPSRLVLSAIKPILDDRAIRLDIGWMMRAGRSTICSKGKRSGQSVCSRCLLSAEPVMIIWGDGLYFCLEPAFAEKYFSKGVTKETLLRAPVVSFNH